MHILALVMMLAFWIAAADAVFAVEESKGGQEAFNNACRTCHSSKAGDNRLGPNLNKIVGRKAGSTEGYAYSESMKKAGITWDDASLDKFITNPDSVVPGNNMKPFTGISDAGQRKEIIEFLKTATD